jgi:hypothetical protein
MVIDGNEYWKNISYNPFAVRAPLRTAADVGVFSKPLSRCRGSKAAPFLASAAAARRSAHEPAWRGGAGGGGGGGRSARALPR